MMTEHPIPTADILEAVALVPSSDALAQARNCLCDAARADRRGDRVSALNSALAAYHCLGKALATHLAVQH